MSKGRRRVQNKKPDNKPKNQGNSIIKKRVRKDRQTNFTKACSKINENTTENENCRRKRITSNRVTVPFGFFAEGVKSKIVRKNAKRYTLNQESCNFLNEDLHALLRNAPDTECVDDLQHSRNSNHMVTRSRSSQNQKHYKTASDYYMKLDPEHEDIPHTEDIQQPLPQSQGSTEKSMFKEIDKCYSKILAEQEHCNNRISNFNNISRFEDEPNSAGNFCKNLAKQLSSVTLRNRKAQCLNKIKATILEINDALEGKEVSHSPKAKPCSSPSEDVFSTVNLIPKSRWLYETPTEKTLKRPINNSSNNRIKRTILPTNAKCKSLFELSSDTSSPKFFESNSYNAFSKIIPSISKKQTTNNLEFKCVDENFKYAPQTIFNTQSNINELFCTNKNEFLCNDNNQEELLNGNNLFQNNQIPYSKDNLLFMPNSNHAFKKPLRDINSPDYFSLPEAKQQNTYHNEGEPSANAFNNFNKGSTQLDIFNKNLKCSGFEGRQSFNGSGDFFFSTNQFYGKEPFRF